MTIRPHHWLLPLLAAAMLHALAGVGWRPTVAEFGAEQAGDQGIEVMLGDGGVANDDEEPTPEPTPEPAPEPRPEPKPEPKPAPPPPVPPPPQPAPTPSPEPLLDAATPSQAVSTAAQAAAAPAPAPEPARQHRSGGMAGGTTAQRENYFGKLAAHLARHKRYPVEARRRKITGIVTLHFRFDAQGVVQNAHIVESSGNQLLDQEALAMLKRAQPLPPIPAELEADVISINLPIDFSLIRR